MTTPTDAPAYLDLTAPPETEDQAPVAANFVNVSGDGDLFSLDFFYVHPAKVDRIFEGAALGDGATREGDTVVLRAKPVARIAIPLTTATELVTELVERIGSGVPHLRGVLEDFGSKLHALSHTEGLDDHGHDDDDDNDDPKNPEEEDDEDGEDGEH
jgi:hypothetical protein